MKVETKVETARENLSRIPGHSRLAMHEGKALISLAGTYPTVLDAILEAIQNTLDANASLVWVKINQKNLVITVQDNGDGRSRAQFEEALANVANSIKDEDKMGRFGRGLISPLGKCDKFSFTSAPKSDASGYLEWLFITKDIEAQSVIRGIPFKPQQSLRYSREQRKPHHGVTFVPWRTEVRIMNYTRDRVIGRLTMESLIDNISDRYGVKLRRCGAKITIAITDEAGNRLVRDVTGLQLKGEGLEEVKITDPDAGETVFKLYLSRRTTKGRNGKVVFGEQDNDFRISAPSFSRSTIDWLGQGDGAAAIAALTSGVFEGEIINSRVTLKPDRRGFERNDALVGLCATLERWYRGYGKFHLERAEETKRDERYQQLGIRSLGVIKALLNQPSFSHILDFFRSLKQGTVGEGHAKIPKDKVLGEQETTSLANQGGAGKTRRSKPKDNDITICSFDGQEEREDHLPLTVTGPHGRKRKVVRSNSLGLQIEYSAMEGSDKLWEFDRIHGILTFNVRHPLWEQCESDDKTLMRFQEYVAVQVLVLETMPEAWREAQRAFANDLAAPFAFMLKHADVIAGRKFGRPSAALLAGK